MKVDHPLHFTKFNMRLMRRIFLAIFTLTSANLARAEYPLYKGGYGTLTAGLLIETAALGQANNRAGGSEKDYLTEFSWDLNAKPHLKGSLNLFKDSTLYGGFSYVYSSTLGHVPSGHTHNNFRQLNDYTASGSYNDYRYNNVTEELFLGWKSGKLLDENENITLDLSGGRQNYKLGSGFLLNYGADNVSNRSGGWLWPRTAFNNTLLGRLNVKDVKFEGFYLETRPLNPVLTRTYQGGNIEFNYSGSSTLGLTYINTRNDNGSTYQIGTQTIDNDTFNARFNFSPLTDFTISTEYAYQINTTKTTTRKSFDKTNVHASGGFGQIEYKREDLFWQPAISYRYAIQGDGFDYMAPGLVTWGTWVQGEITGEWILNNNNLITHVGRLVLTPEDSVTLNLIYLNYTFVNPAAFSVTSPDYGNEADLLADWQFTEIIKFSAGIEAFIPSEGGKQYLGGNANKVWIQEMLYASFDF